ncbi:MAG TPA: ATP-binding protein [bacterium]
MTIASQNVNLNWLIKTYFSNPTQRLKLKRGDRLLEEGGSNDRLYLVLRGTLAGYVKNPDGGQYELFKATRHMFVGVYSFFSKTFHSLASVLAEEDSEVAFISHQQTIAPHSSGHSLFEQFMPVVVLDLANRQQREQEIAFEKERTLKKLVQSEKMASLGQMAAGIAHELNNAIAVLDRNTAWLKARLAHDLGQDHQEEFEYFQIGLQEGRKLSTREVREQTKEYSKRYGLDEDRARKLAETGLTGKSWPKSGLDKITDTVYDFWEMGTTLHDMSLAAGLAAHVVKSVKALASQSALRDTKVDVNESIKEALALLSSPLRKIELKLALAPLPTIAANKGDLVQVWSNLIKNAIEAISNAGAQNGQIKIESKTHGKHLIVHIQDNGPGVPKENLPKIFQPSFTTKEKGLNFGLGLGLTIVESIVTSYNGEIAVKSKPGETIFTVKLPS